MLIKHESLRQTRRDFSSHRGRARVLAATVVAAMALAACDTDDGRQMQEPTNTIPPTTSAPPGSSVLDSIQASTDPFDDATSASAQADLALVAPWQNGAEIPALYTCDGDEVSPALHWAAGPDSTVEFAIAMMDPDAANFVHWVVTGIDPATTSIEQGSLPPGVTVGPNSAGEKTYMGPCPPANETHNYVVIVYALSQQMELSGDEQPAELVALMDAASVTSSTVSGTYTRVG